MSRYDAEQVKHHLEKAAEHAVPLKTPDLTRKIGDAKRYITEKLDPKKGGWTVSGTALRRSGESVTGLAEAIGASTRPDLAIGDAVRLYARCRAICPTFQIHNPGEDWPSIPQSHSVGWRGVWGNDEYGRACNVILDRATTGTLWVILRGLLEDAIDTLSLLSASSVSCEGV